ncbi:MAG: alpha-L-fucosidase [Clostridia bacterium]|nr:alpha-L-fucosidase [Clostridia bacterium]
MKTIGEYLKIVDEVIEKGEFKDNWESLSKFKMPSWYRKGRFGLFVHWGVYSVPAYFNEWYPRLMYLKGQPCYNHRIKTYGENSDYRDIVEKFNPTEFNAQEWADIFKSSGAQHVMPVCEHHDGIKMYESELNRWNTKELLGRDFMLELKESIEGNGMKFFVSNHRAEHYFFLNGARKFCPESEINKGINQDLYGPAALPDNGNPYADTSLKVTKEWCEDWLASSCEMIDRLQPYAVYFDWWIYMSEFKPYIKKFLAYYYNRGIEWGKEVGVFYKWGSIMTGCAIYDVERGQIDNISTELWQNDTAIAKNSWGYTDNNSFKKPADLIRNMMDVVSKNGCFMLNVGPKASGVICEEEKAVLKKIGEWLKVNGEAVYDSMPFYTYGEGKKIKNKAFNENLKYGKNDYRFTFKTGAIYVFPMCDKIRNSYKIKSLRFANEGGIRYDIQKVEILGQENIKVEYKRDKSCMTLNILGEINSDMPICFKISID